MVFQEPGVAFDPVYTIGQQIVQTIRAHEPISKGAAVLQALELLERVQIPQAARRFNAYPHELSGGMLQRAMIALALSCKPKLLLADEPTTALDATVQIQILLLLRVLQKEMNMSVIFVTHDIGAAVEVADRIAVMYAGRIVEQSGVSDVVHRPMHPYTAGLLASTLGASDKGHPLKAVPGAPPDMSNPPLGCAFATRCDHASAACLVQPQVRDFSGHTVACWHPLNVVTA
jgi:peptide/nickel transport system ATP-binding protein